MNIDQLIEERRIERENKNWKRCDEIRNALDLELVFIFDNVWGQEVFYLTDKYFTFKDKFERTEKMTKRQYVEYKIQKNIRVEKVLNSWIHSLSK